MVKKEKTKFTSDRGGRECEAYTIIHYYTLHVFIAVVGEDSCTCAVTQSHCLAKVNYMEALAHNSLAILAKLYFNTYII